MSTALCTHVGVFGMHEEPAAWDRTDGLCHYHGKLKDELIAQNGADSRRGIGNHTANPRRHYDYAAWLDGQPHTLTWNVDFNPDTKPMTGLIRKAARKRGLTLELHIEGGYHGTIAILAAGKVAA